METQVSSPDPLPDEGALLREALAFIGDLEGDAEDLSSLDVDINTNDNMWSPLRAPLEPGAAQAAPVSALENGAPPPLVWPTRGTADATKREEHPLHNSRREEVLYLREMVRELESKLAQVKRQGDKQNLLEAMGEEAQSCLLVRAAWEQVATRQALERERAHMENIGLKRLLENQIRLAKSLERLLRKRPKLGGTGQKFPAKKQARLPSSWDDTLIFEDLLTSSESQYLETPRVLAKVLPLVEGTVNDLKVELVHDDDLGMVIRATELRILPFEWELVTQEFWEVIPKATSDTDVEKSHDLIKAKFRVHASFGRMRGDIAVSTVDRRYHEPHRTVITSSAFSNMTDVSDMRGDEIYTRYKSWIVFEPIVSDATSRPHAPTKAATRMITYSVLVPQAFEKLEDQSRKVGTLTNFLMSSISVELGMRQQEFENRLFDRSRERVVK